ncbi:MAG: O-acetyl-ADP-ribose deacetylase [Chloroflexi bacterium]|nr:O-acetyl-ADP-ribose deacetylase [Chloroflexota bacterium]MCC6894716.1 O-acetyl-ADP-ribose deacetylase [Anaerolineae bacterium]
MRSNPIYRVQVENTLIELLEGDITTQAVDAIVNAANSSLLGGGGVDGAIHRAAGPELLAETRTLNGCKTGDAKITGGYLLKAKHVIHTVGPIYQARDPNVPLLLASAYRRSLEVAAENHIETIAFPSISTGAYGYPVEEAAPIALQSVFDFVKVYAGIKRVDFMLFNASIKESYATALKTLTTHNPEIMKPM